MFYRHWNKNNLDKRKGGDILKVKTGGILMKTFKIFLLITITLCLSVMLLAKDDPRYILTLKDYKIASVSLGYSISQVKSVYPDLKYIQSYTDKMSGQTVFSYGVGEELRFSFLIDGNNSNLSGIQVLSNKYKTARGVKVGDSIDYVFKVYKKQSYNSSHPLLYYYSYDYGGYIIFNINQNKMIVDSIGISYGD